MSKSVMEVSTSMSLKKTHYWIKSKMVELHQLELQNQIPEENQEKRYVSVCDDLSKFTLDSDVSKVLDSCEAMLHGYGDGIDYAVRHRLRGTRFCEQIRVQDK